MTNVDVDRVRFSVGCIPRTDVAPPPADPDLRQMTLPAEWNTMSLLTLRNGNTTHLPPLPLNLVDLNVDKNQLEELPRLPDSLRTISACYNQLTRIPRLPTTLESLLLTNNNLTSFPEWIPTSLLRFSISHNSIQTIPSLERIRLVSLGIGFNRLTSLPTLPTTLEELGCSNNEISEIQNLPDGIRVLNCSNNPIRRFRIENLRSLETLIANNCELSEIPILPELTLLDGDEDRANFYFDNNPLLPSFAAIYRDYRESFTGWQRRPDGSWGNKTKGSTKRFRDEVLAEHRRILRDRASSISAIAQTLKAKGGPLQGNFNPANLIAQFITGVPGPLEKQRLAMLEQREEIGNIPAGSAAAARERIADVAVQREPLIGPPTKFQANLAKRAGLYLSSEELEAAKIRFQKEIEQKLAQMKLDEKKSEILRVYSNTLLEFTIALSKLRTEELEQEREIQPLEESSLSVRNFLLEIHTTIPSSLDDFGIEPLATNASNVDPDVAIIGLEELYDSALLHKSIRTYVRASWSIYMVKAIQSNKPPKGEDLLVRATSYPQWYKREESKRFVETQLRLIQEVGLLLFPDELSESELNKRKKSPVELYRAIAPLLNQFRKNLLANYFEESRPKPSESNTNTTTAESAIDEALEQFVENNDSINDDENIANALDELNAENGANQGGRRKRRTRRNRKSKPKRKTRKH